MSMKPVSMELINEYTKEYSDCSMKIERWRVWYDDEFYIYYYRKELISGEWSWGENREIKHRWFVTISMIDEQRDGKELDQLRLQTLAEMENVK